MLGIKMDYLKKYQSVSRKINNMDAFEFIIPADNLSPYPIKKIILGKDNWIYQIFLMASSQDFINQCEPIFEKMLLSFEVK